MKLNIDRLAQQALRERSPAKVVKISNRVEPNDDDVPVPLNWQIIVEPLKPKTESAGGIVIAQDAQEAEIYHINVGKVVALGPLAMIGKTPSGLDLSIDKDRVKVGAYVQWQRYVGLKIKVQQDNSEDRLFLALEASDLVQIPNDPYRVRFWV